MTEVVHLTLRDARRTPWKNGRGFTDELAIWPAHASFERGDFDARISKASVAQSGPFSSFAGFDRVLVITSGNGLFLAHEGRGHRERVRLLEPYRFSGDDRTTADLVDGPVADFSVFACRDRLTADVQVLRLARRQAREPLDAAHALVHVLTGSVTARVTGEESPFELAAGDSLRIDGSRSHTELALAGSTADTVALLVRITPSIRSRSD
jgi:environmental stress-induced protein Ves